MIVRFKVIRKKMHKESKLKIYYLSWLTTLACYYDMAAVCHSLVPELNPWLVCCYIAAAYFLCDLFVCCYVGCHILGRR